MQEIAPNVHLLSSFPNYSINTYVIGDVLLDASTRMAGRGILRQIKGMPITAHALTHVHPDHQGSSKIVCDTLNIPLWCSQTEVSAMESGDMSSQIPRHWVTNLQDKFWTGSGHPVSRALCEGDIVGGFTVLTTPGHSPGHLAYWRESDRVLILGDVAVNIDFLTMQTRLAPPPAMFTINKDQNSEAARKLAALRPRIVCFGHGEPLLDGAKFVDYVDEWCAGNSPS